MIKIAHASDIQTRVFKRHKEFRDHFHNFYESLKQQQPDAIVLTGDIIHDKTHVSPELFDMEVDFFKALLGIAPVHVIPGNHDGNLNNLSRLDSLTPIFKAIGNNNLHYYKESGIYNIYEDLNFVVFSCFDDESRWPTKLQIDQEMLNIGLFHGMIQGAELQNGQIVQEHPYKLKNFLNIVDYLLLGDIHKMQFLDSNYKSAYAGSLIQQNYAESIEKGYLLWKIESKKKHSVDFVKLSSICPFYTIKLSEDLAVPLSLDFQKKGRIRVISRPLTSSEKKKIEDDVNFKYEPVEVVFNELDNIPAQIVLNEDAQNKVENLEDLEVQEKLFNTFLTPYNLPEDTLKKVLELNRKYDAKSKTEEDIKRNIQFKIGKMSFYNMLSYGEDNTFDFSKYKGILGVFGKNAVGKSSLVVDIPLYIFLNKISKKGVVKNDLLINEHKDNCGGSLEISLGNDKYTISRSTSVYVKTGKNKGEPVYQGKTEVDFKCLHADGTEEDKNGLQRDDTDKIVRQVFGTAEDFMATSIAPQWELLGLIAAGGTKRQELIGKYFDIDIFEQKNKLAKEDLKAIKAEIKIYEAKNLDPNIEEQSVQLAQTGAKIHASKKSFIDTKQKLQETLSKIEVKEKKANNYAEVDRLLQSKQYNGTNELRLLNSKINSMKNYPCIKNPDCCLLKDLEEEQDKQKKLKESLDLYKAQIEENKKKLDEYLKSKELSEDEKLVKSLESDADKIYQNILSLTELQGSLKRQIEQLQKDKIQYLKVQEEYQIYDYFLLATSRDGISKSIIAKNLGIINTKIKKIMSSGVNFEVELVSTEEGKSIEIFFKHERSKPRRIELCSGMEKTITAIALRAALVSVTTLPRSNIFVLDEVFSSLDPEYVDSVTKMLDSLRDLFEVIVIITHLDAFKDICDHSVEIARNDEGYSKLVE
jgi:DNA repair exonuclease SbcCD nuclease subunit/ABC-type branched-subunit amino acid transport system ATPase component